MKAPVSLRRAIATLLRLAAADLGDARILAEQGSLRNAAALAQTAVAGMVEAVVASEQGWPVAPGGTAANLPNENPITAPLQALEATPFGQPRVLADGRTAKPPDASGLHGHLARVAAALAELTGRFGVELESDAPADSAAPIRPQPAPPPEPPPPSAAPPVAAFRKQAASRLVKAPLQPPVAPERSAPIIIKPRAPTLERPRRPVEPSAIIQPAARVANITSVVFWSLMDRWGVADPDALALIDHPGGLTKKGTRPRFKLVGAEADMLHRLQEIDGALTSLALDQGKWLYQAIAGPPFLGTTPTAFMTQNRAAGAREVSRYILQQGLRSSLGGR